MKPAIERAKEPAHWDAHEEPVPGCELCIAEAAKGCFDAIPDAHWAHTEIIYGEPEDDRVKAVVVFQGRALLGLTYVCPEHVREIIYSGNTEVIVQRLRAEVQLEVEVCEDHLGWHSHEAGEARYRRQLVESWTSSLEGNL